MADAEGLIPISNTDNASRHADIVFVHGLRGGSQSTWEFGTETDPNYFFWPEELGKDFPNCGIWSLGYPAGITEIGDPGMIIELRAGNLAQKLANFSLGSRPLIFITHSMGGLVVKALVVKSQTLADKDQKRIVNSIKGIVFCATPHRGSAFADAAGILAKFVGGSQDHVDEMKWNDKRLDLLHQEFIEWQRIHPIPILSYAENNPLCKKGILERLNPLGVVVPLASANPDISGYSVHVVDDDHLSLVALLHKSAVIPIV